MKIELGLTKKFLSQDIFMLCFKFWDHCIEKSNAVQFLCKENKFSCTSFNIVVSESLLLTFRDDICTIQNPTRTKTPEMSDALGRLHVHLHSRSVLKLWRDEEWAALSPQTLLKSDTTFESELMAMARPKANHDNSKGEDEDDSFDDVLTARRAMQILELGPDRGGIWADKGYQRLLSMALGTGGSLSDRGGNNTMSLSFSNGVLR